MTKYVVCVDNSDEECSCEIYIAIECESKELLHTSLMTAATNYFNHCEIVRNVYIPTNFTKDELDAWEAKRDELRIVDLFGTTVNMAQFINLVYNYEDTPRYSYKIDDQFVIKTLDEWFEDQKEW